MLAVKTIRIIYFYGTVTFDIPALVAFVADERKMLHVVKGAVFECRRSSLSSHLRNLCSVDGCLVVG